MKKRLLSILVLISFAVSALSSCSLLFGEVADEGSVSIVVENPDGSLALYVADLASVENKNEGAKGILEHLRDGEDGLYLEIQNGSYGAYITAIGGIKEDLSAKMYIIVYTSAAFDSYEGAPTFDYNGTTLYVAGVGLSSMSVASGTVILFRLQESIY